MDRRGQRSHGHDSRLLNQSIVTDIVRFLFVVVPVSFKYTPTWFCIRLDDHVSLRKSNADLLSLSLRRSIDDSSGSKIGERQKVLEPSRQMLHSFERDICLAKDVCIDDDSSDFIDRYVCRVREARPLQFVRDLGNETFSITDADSVHRRYGHSTGSREPSLAAGSTLQSNPIDGGLPTDEVTLKRHLGLFSGVCFIVGIIIGEAMFTARMRSTSASRFGHIRLAQGSPA